MEQAIEACAARLAALGIRRCERVAFLGLNQPMFFLAMFAAARLGAIFVPPNFRLTGPELAFMIEDCAARVLIVDVPLRPVIEPQRERLKSLKAFLAAEDEAHWTKGPAPETAPVRVGEDDVAMIMYTSGTTGRPKGAMLSHGNIWWNNANGMHTLDCLADDVTLTAADLLAIIAVNDLLLDETDRCYVRNTSTPAIRRANTADGVDVKTHYPHNSENRLKFDAIIVSGHRLVRVGPNEQARDAGKPQGKHDDRNIILEAIASPNVY